MTQRKRDPEAGRKRDREEERPRGRQTERKRDREEERPRGADLERVISGRRVQLGCLREH